MMDILSKIQSTRKIRNGKANKLNHFWRMSLKFIFSILLIFFAFYGNPIFARGGIKEVFLSNQHEVLQESLRIFYGDGSLNDLRSRKEFLRKIAQTPDAVIDEKNFYIKLRRNSAMGGYEREFALFFTPDEKTILAISEKNSSMQDEYTKLIFLCEAQTGWSICTAAVFPVLQPTDFLISGKQMSKRFNKYFSVQYLLPQKGTSVRARLLFDRYAFEANYQGDDAENAINEELGKFIQQDMVFHWDKKKIRFSLQK